MYLNSVKNRSLNAKTRRSNAVITRILTIFKSLIKLLKKRKKPEIGLITGFLWRRRWDSNPRTLADQLISSVLSIVEISRKSGAELEVGIPGKCSKIKCFWTSQRRQASRGKGSKDVRCSLRIWREFGSLERKLERKEREQRATHTRLVLVKQMR